jgi:flagellar hook-length control protein FliK
MQRPPLRSVLSKDGRRPWGSHRLTIRLEPETLGLVEIRIERPRNAPARVEVTAERAETMTALLRDTAQLEQTLDTAGVPSEGRILTFQIAPDASPGAGSNLDDHRQGSTAQSETGQGGGGDGGSGQARPQSGSDGETEEAHLPAGRRWMRAGIDITA